MEGNKIGFLQATDGIYNVDIGVIVSNDAVELAYYSDAPDMELSSATLTKEKTKTLILYLIYAERVSDYVFESPFIKDIDMIEASCIGLMHDLLEDTDYDPDKDDQSCWCFDEMIEAVRLLTKPKDISYDEYCKKLHDGANTHVGMLAYVVKLADIKDHLSQIDTLTPQLKEKYLSGLRYLL